MYPFSDQFHGWLYFSREFFIFSEDNFLPHHFKSNSSLFLTDFLTGGDVMFVKAVSVIFIRTVGISARKKNMKVPVLGIF